MRSDTEMNWGKPERKLAFVILYYIILKFNTVELVGVPEKMIIIMMEPDLVIVTSILSKQSWILQ